MARIQLASYFNAINGRIGDIVLYNYFDRQYARSRVTPRNPNTASQVFVRRTFGDAVRAWQALDDDRKRKFNKKGRMRSISGYNLFISEYMKVRMPVLRSSKDDRIFPACSRPVVPVLLQYTSVPAPLFNRHSYNSPPIAIERDKIPA
ncbi:MAG TPA: hypothetical protein PK514_12375 [Spirochaetota bacterium]|nr:hypothetical protein [Spirochaetota bacterium]